MTTATAHATPSRTFSPRTQQVRRTIGRTMMLVGGLWLALTVLSLTSCAAIAKLEETTNRLELKLAQVDAAADAVKAAGTALGTNGTQLIAKATEVQQAVRAADLNKDGSVKGYGEILSLVNSLGLLVMGWFTNKNSNTATAAKDTSTLALANTTNNTATLTEHKTELNELYDGHVANANKLALVSAAPLPASRVG